MGRPAKPAALSSGKVGKDTRKNRAEAEKALRGGADKISPPDWLNDRQKEIFDLVVDEYAESKILGNLDVYVLTYFSVAVERLEEIERRINVNTDLMLDKDIMRAKTKYKADVDTGVVQLSLSPQTRAKLGGINIIAEKEKADPVLKVLEGKVK